MNKRSFNAESNLFNLTKALPISYNFKYTERIMTPFTMNIRGDQRAHNIEEEVEVKLNNGDYLILYTHGKEISVTVETSSRQWVLKLENGNLIRNDELLSPRSLEIYEAYITECVIDEYSCAAEPPVRFEQSHHSR